jgi:hypothetical protein
LVIKQEPEGGDVAPAIVKNNNSNLIGSGRFRRRPLTQGHTYFSLQSSHQQSLLLAVQMPAHWAPVGCQCLTISALSMAAVR